MDYHIVKISRNKKQYLDLLLLGDEQEIMIDRYLERGDLFVLEDNGIKAVCVVTLLHFIKVAVLNILIV